MLLDSLTRDNRHVTDTRKRTIGSIVSAVHQCPIVVCLSCLVSALSLVLLTGCLWDMTRWASDRQQPTVVFCHTGRLAL